MNRLLREKNTETGKYIFMMHCQKVKNAAELYAAGKRKILKLCYLVGGIVHGIKAGLYEVRTGSV